MAITADVKNQLFRPSGASNGEEKLIRLPTEPLAGSAASRSRSGSASPSSPYAGGHTSSNGRAWTPEEHDRFLEGLEMFPSGPWKEIAAHVGTRTTRQTMTHAQKYREKIARRKRGLRAPSASSTHSRALRRQSQPRATVAMPPTSREASPRCVDGANSPSDSTAVAPFDDPLDFGGCFGPLYLAHSMTPYLAPMAELGSLLADVEPLPMSEEEIDQLLDAAAMMPSVHAETAFIV